MRTRQHVNVNALAFESLTCKVPVLDERVVELEIGCADAQFLFERAARDPSRRYIGLEIRENLVNAVNRRAKEEGLPVEALFVHATHHLEKLFSPGTVRHCYLNFPDPWFKRRHRDRRMINDQLLRKLHPIIDARGCVFMQSDVFDVALDAMAHFEALSEIYENMAGAEWSFWKEGNPFGVRSWREENCESERMPVWRMRYRPLAS